jgi:hypothetical protein
MCLGETDAVVAEITHTQDRDDRRGKRRRWGGAVGAISRLAAKPTCGKAPH